MYTNLIYFLYYDLYLQLHRLIISIVGYVVTSLFDTSHTLFESISNCCYCSLMLLFFVIILSTISRTYFFFIHYVDCIALSLQVVIFEFGVITPLTHDFSLPLFLTFISIPQFAVVIHFPHKTFSQ
jgi:hypothetical protein